MNSELTAVQANQPLPEFLRRKPVAAALAIYAAEVICSVLLALAFWGAIWGLAGMFLSTPLTVMAMVILAQFPGTRWMAVLLSADGEPDRLKDQQPGVPPPDAPDSPLKPKPDKPATKPRARKNP